ncbi:MAG TPA: DNA recombination protein RmuC [Candidatus Acidoferrales bacterium]|nr:DNA recombination protein RmuC [Candidatus Acidoferrales bacterium]
MTVITILIAIGCLAAGFAIAWVWAKSSAAASRLELERRAAGLDGTVGELKKQNDSLQQSARVSQQRIEEEQKLRAAAEKDGESQRANLLEQRRLLDEAQQKLREAFQSLAGEALKASSDQFMELAKAKFDALQKEAEGDLENRKQAIQSMVNPLETALKDLRSEVSRVESARQEAYGSLRSEVQLLATTNRELREETGSLVNSLKQPQVKGKWGELTLRRVVELAGMSPHCDFLEQQSVDTEEGRLRPDLIVNLPGGSQIVVDVKVPLHAFFKAVNAQSDAEYREAMLQHAALVREHIKGLSSKEYWRQFEPTPEFVVLFVPGESFFSAALEQDRTLIEDAIDKRVVLASPTTLIALLRAVAYGWKQQLVAENAERIKDLGRELYERVLTFAEHLSEIAKGLERANKAYNNAVASFDSRLIPSARKLREMGIGSEEVPQIEPVETLPRPLLSTPVSEEE